MNLTVTRICLYEWTEIVGAGRRMRGRPGLQGSPPPALADWCLQVWVVGGARSVCWSPGQWWGTCAACSCSSPWRMVVVLAGDWALPPTSTRAQSSPSYFGRVAPWELSQQRTVRGSWHRPSSCPPWLVYVVCKTSYHSDSRKASGGDTVPRFPLGAGRAHWPPIGRALSVSTNQGPVRDVTPSQSSWCQWGQTDSNLDLGN